MATRSKLPTSNGATLDNFGSTQGVGSPRTLSFTVGVSSGTLVACIATQDSNDPNIVVSTVTYGGVALTKVRSDHTGSNDIRSEIWYLANPTPGTANLVVTTVGNVWIAVNASSWSNLLLTGQPSNSDGRSANSSAPSLTTTPTYGHTLLMVCLASKANVTSINTNLVSLGTSQGASYQNLSVYYRVVAGLDSMALAGVISSGTDWNITVGWFKSNTPYEAVRIVPETRQVFSIGGRSKLTVGQ